MTADSDVSYTMSLPSKVDTAKSGELGEYEYRSVEVIVMEWQVGTQCLSTKSTWIKTKFTLRAFNSVLAAITEIFVRRIGFGPT